MVGILEILLFAILAGFLGSLIGLGGGSILTPILVLFGVPVKFAIAASMVAIIASSSGSASTYVKEGIVNVRVAFYLEMFTIVGAIVGATITAFVAPAFLYFFFAAFLLSSIYGIRSRLSEVVPSEVRQDRLAKWLGLEGSYFDKSLKRQVDYKLTRPILGGAGMFVAGIAAGSLGIGAGAFKVSIHERILRMPSKVSSTTSNFIIGMTALAGTSIYVSSGLLYLGLVVPMVIGTTVGSLLGGRMLNKMPNKTLRILFLAIVLFLIVDLLYEGVLSL